MVTEVPEGAQPGPSANNAALSSPTDAFIGPDIAGSSVLFWCQPGTWLIAALCIGQWLPPCQLYTSTLFWRA